MQHRLVQTAIALATAGTLHAGTDAGKAPAGKGPVAPATKEECLCDKIFSLATLYSDDSNPIIEKVAFTGRYHGQFFDTDGSESESDWENRRFRYGLETTLFNKHLVLKGEAFGDPSSDGDLYEGFTELWAAFKPNGDDSLVITAGQQKPKFTSEWSTSSRLILTFERARMINQFRPDYTTGLSVAGKEGTLSWYVGGFANDTDEVFAKFDGGYSFIASVGYDFKEALGADKAVLRADYIHSSHEENDTIFTAFDNGVEVSFDWKQGPLGVYSAVQYGSGDDDVFGASVMPTYDITKQLQAVVRYQLGTTSSEEGLSAQRRYERAAGVGSGDFYQAIYGGLNYYICEHKLKLMAGVEYADMDGGGDALTFLTGIRVYW